VWVGVWFSSWLYYPFGKGPGQHIIRCLKNKKCENELPGILDVFTQITGLRYFSLTRTRGELRFKSE